MAQGFTLKSKDKYKKSYEECLNLVYLMSGEKLSVTRELFKRIIFAYIIGNDDMHLKNISMLRREQNKSLFYNSLTPNYDQLFTSSFKNHSIIGYLALDLFEEEKDGIFTEMYNQYGFYTGSDFFKLGKKVQLPQKAIQSVLNSFFFREDEMIDMIGRSFMPSEMKTKAAETVRDRIKALKII